MCIVHSLTIASIVHDGQEGGKLRSLEACHVLELLRDFKKKEGGTPQGITETEGLQHSLKVHKVSLPLSLPPFRPILDQNSLKLGGRRGRGDKEGNSLSPSDRPNLLCLCVSLFFIGKSCQKKADAKTE